MTSSASGWYSVYGVDAAGGVWRYSLSQTTAASCRQSIPTGQSAGGISATSWGPGREDVFINGLDGDMWHTYAFPPVGCGGSTNFAPWEHLGDAKLLAGTGPSAVSRASGELDIAFTAPDQSTQLLKWRNAWSIAPIAVNGGTLTSSPSITRGDQGPTSEAVRLDLVGRGLLGVLNHSYGNGPSWAAYENHSTCIRPSTSPVSVWWKENPSGALRYDMFHLDQNGQVKQRIWFQSGWHPIWYTSLPTIPQSSGATPCETTISEPTLPLSRRNDPSMDLYERDQPSYRSPNWGYDPIVAHDGPDYWTGQGITTWYPRVSAYYNATGVSSWQGNGSTDPGNLPRIREARQWFVPRDPASGETEVIDGQTVPRMARMRNSDTADDDWYMLDLRKPAARTWWLYGGDGVATCTADPRKRAALDLFACGYKELWLDNAVFDTWHYRYPVGVDTADWANSVSLLLTELRTKLPAGKSYVINGKWNDNRFADGGSNTIDATTPLGREFGAASQVIFEGGAMFSDAGLAGTASTPFSLRRALLWADRLHAVGGNVQWEKTNSDGFAGITAANNCVDKRLPDGSFSRWTAGSPAAAGHAQTAEFNLAVALVAYARGDGIGDMCEYPDRAWSGYASRNIGYPLGIRSDVATGGASLIVREYSQGVAVVNPSPSATLTYTAPRSAIRIGKSGASTTFSIAPRSGAVLRYQ